MHTIFKYKESKCCENNTVFERSFSSVQSLSCVPLFETPWIAARQASLSITNSRSLLKLISFELVMPSSHLILCHPLLLPPSILLSSTIHERINEVCSLYICKWSNWNKWILSLVASSSESQTFRTMKLGFSSLTPVRNTIFTFCSSEEEKKLTPKVVTVINSPL